MKIFMVLHLIKQSNQRKLEDPPAHNDMNSRTLASTSTYQMWRVTKTIQERSLLQHLSL
jgi:hypothetical protein